MASVALTALPTETHSPVRQTWVIAKDHEANHNAQGRIGGELWLDSRTARLRLVEAYGGHLNLTFLRERACILRGLKAAMRRVDHLYLFGATQ